MAIVTDGLVLYLHGACGKNNPATRVWKDLSGNGNDGELVNFGYTEDSGWVDGGLKFDGVDDYVYLGLMDLREEITVDMIIELNLTDQLYNRIFTSTNDAISLFTIRNNKYINVKFTTSQGSLPRPSASIEFDRVMQVTFNYSTSTGLLKLYIDGELKSEVQRDGTPIANRNPYTIGYVGNEGSFCGKCLSLKLYNRALTDEEILQNYQAGHEWTPQIGKREVTTTMKPITTDLSRKGTGRREVISTVKPITTSLERKGKGKREVISTMKPTTSSLSRRGVGRREVTTTIKPITSSISKKLPPIHANITAKERNPSITTRERIPKLEVD